MKVRWLGHASFLIISDQGVRVITDPYQSGGDLKYGPIKEEADVVLVSHDHADHNYLAGIKGSPQVVRWAGTHGWGAIEFKGVSCYHDNSRGRQRGNNTMFAFTVDGIRLCHAGDLGHLLTEQQLAELGSVDVLLLPVGGFYTIDAAEATQLVEQMVPRVVIPMHYRTEKCLFPISSAEDFLKGKKRVRRLGSSEVELAKETLPSETEIVVLEHAL